MRPLDVGQTLDTSFKLLTARFKDLAIVTAVVLLPVQIISIFVTKALVDELQDGIGQGRFNGNVLLYQGASSFLNMFATYLAQAACLYVLAAWYLRKEELSGSDALGQAFKRMPSILWVVLLIALAVALGMLACVIPGIWLLVAFSVAIPAVVVEGARGTGALGRSYDLVKGRWWATLGRFAVAALLTFAVAFVVGAIVGIGGATVGSSSVTAANASFGDLVLQGLLQWAANIFVLPFWAAVATVVYFDLRVRKEGFDISHLAAGGAPGAPAPAAGPVAPAPAGADTPPAWGQTPAGAAPVSPPAWGQTPAAAPPPPAPGLPAQPSAWGEPPAPPQPAPGPPEPAAPSRPGGSIGPPSGGWAAPSAPEPPPPAAPPPAPDLPSALDSSLGSAAAEPPGPTPGTDPLAPPPEDDRGA